MQEFQIRPSQGEIIRRFPQLRKVERPEGLPILVHGDGEHIPADEGLAPSGIDSKEIHHDEITMPIFGIADGFD